MYRQPIMRTIDRNAIKEVEIPPAAQSHSYDVEYVRKLKEEKSKVPCSLFWTKITID